MTLGQIISAHIWAIFLLPSFRLIRGFACTPSNNNCRKTTCFGCRSNPPSYVYSCLTVKDLIDFPFVQVPTNERPLCLYAIQSEGGDWRSVSLGAGEQHVPGAGQTLPVILLLDCWELINVTIVQVSDQWEAALLVRHPIRGLGLTLCELRRWRTTCSGCRLNPPSPVMILLDCWEFDKYPLRPTNERPLCLYAIQLEGGDWRCVNLGAGEENMFQVPIKPSQPSYDPAWLLRVW